MRELTAIADSVVASDTRAATALLDACVQQMPMPMMESVSEDLFGEHNSATRDSKFPFLVPHPVNRQRSLVTLVLLCPKRAVSLARRPES